MLDPKLGSYVSQRLSELAKIPAERKASLEKIARYVDENIKSGREARLIFICTHNSRRSRCDETNFHFFSRRVKKLMRRPDSNILAIRPTVPDSALERRPAASVCWPETTIDYPYLGDCSRGGDV